MFRNLRAEMVRYGLFISDIAKIAGISEKSVDNKLSGKSEWTRREMVEIKHKAFPNCTLDYLFDDTNPIAN